MKRLVAAALLLIGSSAAHAQQRAATGYVITPDSAQLFYRVQGRGRDTLIAIHRGPGVDLESIAGDFAPLEERHVVINRVVMGSYGDWDIRAALRDVPTPTLIVHGEAESIPMDLVEEWTTALPHARLFKVPRAAHFTYAERPELVWPEVERFLAAP